jgi:hypothetical protein
MNSGSIRKSTTNLQFAQIPNSVCQDKNLTLAEKGLLAYLLSLPENWVIYRNQLYNELQDAPGTIDRCWKGLQDKKYIVSERKMDKLGRFIGWEHVVYNNVSETQNHRSRHLPKSESTEVGESGSIQINNSIQIHTNTNKQAVVSGNFGSSADVTFNQVIDILEFEDDASNEAWKDWLEYRKGQRKSVKGRTKEMQLRLLKSLSPEQRIATINQSITQGWTGLFEVKTFKNKEKNDYASDVAAALIKLAENN